MGRRSIPWAAAVALLLIAWPAAASAHGGTEVIVSGSVRAGGGIELTGEGFDANAVVRVELQRANAAPIELGDVPTDDEGEWSATLHVPADARPGLYQVVAIGEDESATAEVTLLEAAAGGAPVGGAAPVSPSVSNDRPAAEVVGLLIFAAALVAAGAALLWPQRGSLLRRGS